MVGLQAMVLGRLGERTPLIQERVLYPAHRHLRAGALRGSGLYNDACVVGRVVSVLAPSNAAFALPRPDAARPACADFYGTGDGLLRPPFPPLDSYRSPSRLLSKHLAARIRVCLKNTSTVVNNV